LLVFHPAFYFSLIFFLEAPQKRLRYNKLLNRTIPWELVGDFISSHTGMARDPIQPQSVLVRDIIKRLLAQLYQGEMLFWQSGVLSEPPGWCKDKIRCKTSVLWAARIVSS
jgi:hypothetical protein